MVSKLHMRNNWLDSKNTTDNSLQEVSKVHFSRANSQIIGFDIGAKILRRRNSQFSIQKSESKYNV